MRATEWKRVVKPLLPDDAWAFRGRAVHRTPVEHVAIGLLAEGSEPQARRWDAGMVERLEELRALVGDGDLDGARHVLAGRAKQTAAALGIARG